MILGFDTGWVHFVSDDGQLLIAKQFLLDKPVIKIRVLNCLPPKRAKFPALSVGRLSELLIIHPDTIVSIDNNILMNTYIEVEISIFENCAHSTDVHKYVHT